MSRDNNLTLSRCDIMNLLSQRNVLLRNFLHVGPDSDFTGKGLLPYLHCAQVVLLIFQLVKQYICILKIKVEIRTERGLQKLRGMEVIDVRCAKAGSSSTSTEVEEHSRLPLLNLLDPDHSQVMNVVQATVQTSCYGHIGPCSCLPSAILIQSCS